LSSGGYDRVWSLEQDITLIAVISSRFGGDKSASKKNFEDGMLMVFKSCHAALKVEGILVMPVLVLASLAVPRHCATPGCLCSGDIFVRRPTRYRTRPGSEGTSEFCDLDYPTTSADRTSLPAGRGARMGPNYASRFAEASNGMTANPSPQTM
jgi:hypothetical protein